MVAALAGSSLAAAAAYSFRMATCSSESAFLVASVAWRRSLRKAPFIFSIFLLSSVSGFFSFAAGVGAAVAAGASSAAKAAEPASRRDRATSWRSDVFIGVLDAGRRWRENRVTGRSVGFKLVG